MPLTLERDGIVCVMVFKKPAWYIVDPEAEGGFDPALKSLLQSLKPTQRSEWQFIARVTVFLIVWLLVGGGMAYISNMVQGIDAWRGLIYGGAIILGLLVAWVAIIPVFPLRPQAPRQLDSVRLIPHDIVKWADDSITADRLWSLVEARHRLEDVRRLAIVVLDDWNFEYGGDLQQDAAHTLVIKTLKREFNERRTHYVRIAKELGFVPSGVELSGLSELESWMNSER